MKKVSKYSDQIICRGCKRKTSKYNKSLSICNVCRNERIKAKKEREFEDNPSKYLLYESCKAACRRGSKTYTESPYTYVTCQWDKPLEMLNDLMDDNQFWEDWKEQTTVYISKNKKRDERPTIDRINENGNYDINNIQVLPMKLNMLKGSSNECLVHLIKNKRIVRVLQFESVKDAARKLKFSAEMVNNGTIIDIGVGQRYKALVYAEKSKDRSTDKPKYRMVIGFEEHNRLDNGDVEITCTQEVSILSGINFSLVNGGGREKRVME
ncbi:hypothetical protein [Bacillus sp. N1-1]|uniref:hypothetical protein n=1 Tax=Bacillus sp. N1-1 TaxID=2682541 RepID=UPI001316C300|nr:hypothetical protein [Bacillus sp. N1-1]QHA92252.1 hypothetical protein GNK04_12895 [Bacillus sp. N1-1]